MNYRHSVPTEVLDRIANESDRDLAARGLYGRRGRDFVDTRSVKIELRDGDVADTVSVVGYATTWDTWYDVAGGAPYGWSESIAKGAASRTLAEKDDVRFLFDHTGIPMARTKSATMRLTADDIGLLVEVPNLDVRNNAFAAAMASAIERGDVDEMSFAFAATRQEWNDDYTERQITELRMYDVSSVTFPANDATIVGLRSEKPTEANGDPKTGISLEMAQALAFDL